MSLERYGEIVRETCAVVGLPNADYVLQTHTLEVEGFDVRLDHFENDPAAATGAAIRTGRTRIGRRETAMRSRSSTSPI